MNHQQQEHSRVVEFPERKTVQEQAAIWLAKLDGDQPSKATLIAFRQWVNKDDSHRQAFEQLAARWGELNRLTQLSMPSEQRQQQAPVANNVLGISQSWASGAVMASVLLLVLTLWQWPADSNGIYSTAIGEQQTVQLNDGSVLRLNTNSRLRVDYSEQRRGIYLLQGEAHFEVAHNPEKPFEVYAGTGLVRAVGTAFSVRMQPKAVVVLVNDGVVEIDKLIPPSATLPATPAATTTGAQPNAELAQLHAGTQGTYQRDTPEQVTLEQPEALDSELAWLDGMLEFRNENLQDLVDEISRYTTLSIVVLDNKTRERKVGGLFKVGDTQAMLEALELSFGVQVDRIDSNTVYLSSPETQQKYQPTINNKPSSKNNNDKKTQNNHPQA